MSTESPTPDARATTTPSRVRACVQGARGAAAGRRPAGIARPTLGGDEVLVRVHAAGGDQGAWHLMAGLPYPIRLAGFGFRAPKARVPGRELAGRVDAVGPA